MQLNKSRGKLQDQLQSTQGPSSDWLRCRHIYHSIIMVESHSSSLHTCKQNTEKEKAETAHLVAPIQRPPRTRTRTSGAASYRFSSHGHSGWWGGLINRLEHVQRPGSLGSCCHFALGVRNRRAPSEGVLSTWSRFGPGSATNSKQRSTCRCGDVSGLRLMWVCIPEYSANRHFPSDELLRQGRNRSRVPTKLLRQCPIIRHGDTRTQNLESHS